MINLLSAQLICVFTFTPILQFNNYCSSIWHYEENAYVNFPSPTFERTSWNIGFRNPDTDIYDVRGYWTSE